MHGDSYFLVRLGWADYRHRSSTDEAVTPWTGNPIIQQVVHVILNLFNGKQLLNLPSFSLLSDTLECTELELIDALEALGRRGFKYRVNDVDESLDLWSSSLGHDDSPMHQSA